MPDLQSAPTGIQMNAQGVAHTSHSHRSPATAYSQPPMGPALPAIQVVEIKRTRPKGIGKS